MRPLIIRLNERIDEITRAIPFRVSDTAPNTFAEVKQAAESGILTVWAGASDATVYADASVNWKFRAWHDALHLSLNAPFTLEGESAVAAEQARILGDDVLGAVMLIEVIEQAKSLQSNGIFVVDQVQFVKNHLNTMGYIIR